MKHTIKSIPESERPYEKCLRFGAEHLTDSELLAIILRTGFQGENSLNLARSVLERCSYQKGLLGLTHMTVSELMEIKGIGKVKAVQLLCIGELSKRISAAMPKPSPVFTSPEEIAAMYMERMRHKEQEELLLLLFNTKNKLIQEVFLTKGTVNAALVSPREIFLEALKYHAVSIVLIHNHPSGDPNPSKEDLLITKRISEAGAMLGISLLDHLIIGDNIYTSLKRRGCIE